MKHHFALFLLLLAASLAAFSQQQPAQAIVPRLIRFTGQIKDTPGPLGITFTLHRSQTDNAALWIETQNVQVDSTGKYTVLLGATKSEGIPMELFTSGEAQWLGIHVAGQPDSPRVLLVSVPYALKAAEAETLAGHTAADFVTSDKLNTAVQEQMQSAHFNTSTGRKNAIHAVVTDPATNFVDSNATQVVSVTQNGTGQGLVANAKSNTAITGNSTATTGSATGVLGESSSKSGIGIRGFASATTGATVGLFGSAASTSGIAIAANESATSGSTVGLEATASSPTGVAAIFQNAAGGPLIDAYNGVGSSRVLRFSVDGAGNVDGSSFNAANTITNHAFQIGGIPVFGIGNSSDANLFVGQNAGVANATGIGDTFVGKNAGTANTSGQYNTFVGSVTGSDITTTSSNTFLGYGAGFFSTGSRNTLLGASAGANLTSGDDNVYIAIQGCAYPCTESDTIRIGDGSVQTATYIAGIYNQSPSANASPVWIGSDGKLGLAPVSSRRFKDQITDMGARSNKLFQLRPVTFFYNHRYDDGTHTLQYGLIAEEVAQLYPELVTYDADGKPFSVKYQSLTPMMLNAMQKEHRVVSAQQQVIASQQKQMQTQQKEIDDLQKQVTEMRAMVQELVGKNR